MLPLSTFLILWGMVVYTDAGKYEESCEKKLFVESGESNFTSDSVFVSQFSSRKTLHCKYEIETNPGHLIRLRIIRNKMQGDLPEYNCQENYIHVGNDQQRIGVEMLTSYKLCSSTTEQEIVSRDSYIWIIVQSVQPSVFPRFKIQYQSKPKVICNDTMFQCSPVQCVPKSAICNGDKDCDNERDEYCDNIHVVQEATVLPKPSDQTAEPCFLCNDGSCIRPHLPRYSLDWGKQLWYLCDGYAHCPDATDERKDICYRITGRAAALFRCSPTETNLTAYMWNSVLCDGKMDCAGAEDEAADICNTDREVAREIAPVSIILPIAAVTIVILGAIALRALFRMQDRRLTLPSTCMDTTYVFTEFNNSPTAIEERQFVLDDPSPDDEEEEETITVMLPDMPEPKQTTV